MLWRSSSCSLLPQFSTEPPRVLRNRRGEQTHKTVDGPVGTGNHKTSAGDDENNRWPRRMVNHRYGEWTESQLPTRPTFFVRRHGSLYNSSNFAHESSLCFTGKHVAPRACKAARRMKTEPQQHGENKQDVVGRCQPRRPQKTRGTRDRPR